MVEPKVMLGGRFAFGVHHDYNLRKREIGQENLLNLTHSTQPRTCNNDLGCFIVLAK